jgi:cell pole-organizing protein PopZ
MTELHPSEPSMDEILASIRRIISEDESGDGAGEDAHGHHGSRRGEPEGDVLVLSERAAPEAPSPYDPPADEPSLNGAAAHGDVQAAPAAIAPPPAAPPRADVQPAPATQGRGPLDDAGPARGGGVAEASAAFEKLHLAVESAPPKPTPAVTSGGPTLEDITRDLLRPMIAAWLEENLADIVRGRVDEEIERIARGRVR